MENKDLFDKGYRIIKENEIELVFLKRKLRKLLWYIDFYIDHSKENDLSKEDWIRALTKLLLIIKVKQHE
jgi:hypothetical protein